MSRATIQRNRTLRMRNRIATVAVTALTWALMLLFVGAIAVGVLIPRIAGATPFTVTSSSMQPGIGAGSLIVTRPVAPEDIEVGDIITVQLESGKAAYVTHRVTHRFPTIGGDLRFETQGDANDSPDADLRRPEQVRGRLWYTVPYLGYVSTIVPSDA